MNERIKELAKQAGFMVDQSGHIMVCFTSDGNDEVKKFAELIVKECADICIEMSAKCAGLPGDGALAKDCAYWIKKDFGVEE